MFRTPATALLVFTVASCFGWPAPAGVCDSNIAATLSARNQFAGKYQLHAFGAAALVCRISWARGVSASIADASAIHVSDHGAELII